MTQFLKGRTALVTGSTSGIGRGIATALADAGARVMLNGFGDAAEIEALRSDLESRSGADAAYHPADLTKPAEIADLVAAARTAFDRIDVLVNNAGIQFVSPLEEFPAEQWDRIIAINLSAAFHTTRLCIKDMKAANWGRIINNASSHGLISSPYKSAYAAAKHGLVGLTKTAALEGAQSGVTVNAICPGYVLTPLVERQIPEQAHSHGISEDKVKSDIMLASQPTRRFVGIDEVAALAVFLCSDGAASITGGALPIDGGWTAQ